MPSPRNHRQEFSDLLAAYENGDDEAIAKFKDQIQAAGESLSVAIEDDLEWEESMVDCYTECPVVNQHFTVSLGGTAVYEGYRQFGSSLEDPTHTGMGGRWATIRIDDEGHATAEEALEDLGVEIDWPDVPTWR